MQNTGEYSDISTKNSSSISNMSREIALTGATGFIGGRLLLKLSSAGWQVRALYRAKKGREPIKLPNVTWIAGDLDDDAALTKLIEGTEAVIHCAGVVRGVTQTDFDKVNEKGALRVAQVAAKQVNSPRFLLISSLAAREPELSHYSGSKWRGENAVKSAAKNLRWTVIRPPAVFGPGDRELLPLFQSMAKGFAPIPAGKNRRFSMIYVDDLAMAVVDWLATDSGYGQTFELDDGHDNGYDWDTILAIGAKVLRNGSEVRRIPIPIALLKLLAGTNILAAKLFNYAPMLSPGKIREITHSDWVSDKNSFTRITDWQPMFDFERGLMAIFDKNNAEL